MDVISSILGIGSLVVEFIGKRLGIFISEGKELFDDLKEEK